MSEYEEYHVMAVWNLHCLEALPIDVRCRRCATSLLGKLFGYDSVSSFHFFAARWIDAFCFLAVGTDYPSFSKRFCLNTLIARGWFNSPRLWQLSGIGNTCADANPIALRNSSLKVTWTCQSEVRIGVDRPSRSGNQHNLETDKQD